VKSLQKIIVAIFISVLLVACTTNTKDRGDDQNTPREENRNDQMEEPRDNLDRDDQFNEPGNDLDRNDQLDESENTFDRDPDNENILPELETEDEDREGR